MTSTGISLGTRVEQRGRPLQLTARGQCVLRRSTYGMRIDLQRVVEAASNVFQERPYYFMMTILRVCENEPAVSR